MLSPDFKVPGKNLRRNNMNIYEVKARNPQLMEKLLTVWEQSVRATHLFLSQEEIEKLKPMCPRPWKMFPV